jgi:hypothetical protein
MTVFGACIDAASVRSDTAGRRQVATDELRDAIMKTRWAG